MNISYLETKDFGLIEIIEENGYIIELNLEVKEKKKEKESLITKKAKNQLIKYLEGNLKKFNLPLNPRGTDFQKKCWQELIKIPYGKTITYKDQARNIFNEKSYRAVGNANGKNPIPIIIPCHRVIKSDNSIGGYYYGDKIKKILLDIEKIKV